MKTTSGWKHGLVVLAASGLLAGCASARSTSVRTAPPTPTSYTVTPHPYVARAQGADSMWTRHGRMRCYGPPSNGECFPVRGPHGWTLSMQSRLNMWVQRVAFAVGDTAGFGDLRLSFEPPRVIVYFHGAYPAKLTAIIRSAKAHRVVVSPVQSQFGQRASDRASERLASALDAAHIDWHDIGPNGTFTKLEVDGPAVSVDARVQERVRRIAHNTIGDFRIAFVPDPGVADSGDPIVTVHR